MDQACQTDASEEFMDEIEDMKRRMDQLRAEMQSLRGQLVAQNHHAFTDFMLSESRSISERIQCNGYEICLWDRWD